MYQLIPSPPTVSRPTEMRLLPKDLFLRIHCKAKAEIVDLVVRGIATAGINFAGGLIIGPRATSENTVGTR